jgi:hypothetical protein
VEHHKGNLSLFDRFEKTDVAQSVQRRRHQSGADIDDGDRRVGRRQRVDNAHLIGDRGGVDDFADVAVKALERAFRSFCVESARRYIMRGAVVEQSPGDGGLADASLVRADQKSMLA